MTNINIAKQLGYQGDSNTEAQAWISAIDKGLDMSEKARYIRASSMGFKVDKIYYHGTGNDFDRFDKSTIGENYTYSEDSGFFFTQKKSTAENYAYIHSADNKGRVISVFLKFSNPYLDQTTSEYYRPADRFDDDKGNIMHDVNLKGNDSVLIKGVSSDDLCVVFDPSQILSIHAAFDPETESYKSESEMIMNFIKNKNKSSDFYFNGNLSDEIKDFIRENKFKRDNISDEEYVAKWANIIVDKYQDDNVFIVSGIFNDKCHQWIEINQDVFDPLLDGFNENIEVFNCDYDRKKAIKVKSNKKLSSKSKSNIFK